MEKDTKYFGGRYYTTAARNCAKLYYMAKKGFTIPKYLKLLDLKLDDMHGFLEKAKSN